MTWRMTKARYRSLSWIARREKAPKESKTRCWKLFETRTGHGPSLIRSSNISARLISIGERARDQISRPRAFLPSILSRAEPPDTHVAAVDDNSSN